MSIITPNKSTIIRPARPHLCGQCGGLRRQWLRDHRREAGIAGHIRACCCGPCRDHSSVDVTFSGIDAAVKCPCGAIAGWGQGEYFTQSLLVDGSMSVPFSHVFLNQFDGHQYCSFRSTIIGSFGVLGLFEQNDPPQCSVALAPVDFASMFVRVDVRDDDAVTVIRGQVIAPGLLTYPGLYFSGSPDFTFFFSQASVAIGVPLPNTGCGFMQVSGAGVASINYV